MFASNRSNRFHALPMEEDLSDGNHTYEAKISKPPPIVIDNDKQMKSIIEFAGEGYFFKRTSIGTKIMSPTLEKYNELLAKLKTSSTNYFTHRVKNNNTFKMILAGLPKLTEKEIQDELKSSGVDVESIKEIVTKRTNVDDAIYMIEFNRKSVSKKMLYDKVRYISNVSVQWRNCNPKRSGPVLCKKCSMYGHGSENCYRKPVCSICASQEHTSDECGVLTKSVKIFKCFNCTKSNYRETNHKADDPACPCRKEYLDARYRALSKGTKHRYEVRNNTSRPLLHDLHDPSVFPRLPNEDALPVKPKFMPPQGRSYSETAKAKTPEDLFSLEELFNIFQSATDALSRCTSKREQMLVIVKLLNYV